MGWVKHRKRTFCIQVDFRRLNPIDEHFAEMNGMGSRNFALYSGIFFIAIGILGFIPGMVSTDVLRPDSPLWIDTGYGYLFGLFPTNLVHNLVHVAVGVWGFTSSRNPKSALLYSQTFAILYSLIVVMGILPGLGTTFGLMPVFGGNVILNLLATALAAYYGFIADLSPDLVTAKK